MAALKLNVVRLSDQSGVSAPYIYDILSGRSWPSPLYLARICKTLRVTPAEILTDPGAEPAPRRTSLEAAMPLLERLSRIPEEDYTTVMQILDAAIERRTKRGKKEAG